MQDGRDGIDKHELALKSQILITSMHDLPRQKLSELIVKHGVALCDDAKKLEGLLKDLLRNEHKRETFVLVSALREGIVHELHAVKPGLPPAALAAKLTRQLCDNLAMDEAAARWTVESWAFALGVEITPPIKMAAPVNATGTSPAPGVEIIPRLATPIKPVAPVNTSAATSAPGVAVDLAALAMQHREKARLQELKTQQDREKAAQAKAHRAQLAQEAKIRKKAVEKEAKAKAAIMHKQAKDLAQQSRDFAAAARMLEEIDPQLRDAKLYEKICGYRDLRVTALDASIQDAVHNGRLLFLRGRVQELLKLQPKRDDMRRLLERLPDEPELTKEFTNSIGMKFVLIQPGEFTMGSNESMDERPPHLVEITQPFYFCVFPVTQREYIKVMGENPSRFRINTRQPVENVSMGDAVTFCQRLSKLRGGVQHGTSYRLPTEAEWEYACRAGSTGKWCFGDDQSRLGEYAWFADNSDNQTHPVGKKKPNAWGLYDMHGNVWELCSDYDSNYPTGAQMDPRGQQGGSFRGGCWRLGASHCRSAFRFKLSTTSYYFSLGFRIALSPSGQ